MSPDCLIKIHNMICFHSSSLEIKVSTIIACVLKKPTINTITFFFLSTGLNYSMIGENFRFQVIFVSYVILVTNAGKN